MRGMNQQQVRIQLATINVRGLRDPLKVKRLTQRFACSNLDIICLTETWHDHKTAEYIKDLAEDHCNAKVIVRQGDHMTGVFPKLKGATITVVATYIPP